MALRWADGQWGSGMNNSAARSFFSRIWRWSVVVTLPVSLLFSIWGLAVWSRYSDFGLRHPMADTPRIHIIGKMELDHMLRKAELLLRPGGSRGGLKEVHLFLPESAESVLDRELPHSGREYVRGRLLYPDGSVNNVKIKYRGDFWWHWAFYKKSLRVKTKKNDLFQGMRSFNLIAPKFEAHVNNHLSYRLARMMGLLAPRSAMVNLWINGKSRGVFLLVEQLEEMTLRHNRRMPGDLYSGDLVARDRYRGIANDLFIHPGVWEKVAINNHYPEASFAPLEALLSRMPPADRDGIGELGDLLEVHAWGRFLAYEILAQTYHFSQNHNWRLYFDPVLNRFEPVIWDPNGWHPQWMPKDGEKAQLDIRTSRFHDALLANQEVLMARQSAIEKFFSAGLDTMFLREFDSLVEDLDRELSMDPNLVIAFRHLPPSKVRGAIKDLRTSVARVFSDIKREYIDNVRPVRYSVAQASGRLDLAISSRRPATGLRLEYDQPLKAASDLRLGYMLDEQIREVDLSGAVSMRGHSLVIEMPLVADFVHSTSKRRVPMSKTLAVMPGYYWLSFSDVKTDASLQNVYATYSDGTTVRAERVKEIEKRGFDGSTQVNSPVRSRPPRRWSGRKVVEGKLEINDDLIVDPGTEILLKPGATLILEGRLLAEGTVDKPIKFIPFDSKQAPWGAVVLRDSGSDGSVLRHCEVSGGSGYKTDLREYSAMFSIHGVRDVSIADCYFRDSNVVDDMLRAVYSRVEIRDSVFENALFDAVDFDIAEGLVERCRFENSGNDALDLMASNVVVVDSRVLSAGDKGISVGEGTALVAINNYLQGNAIGVEAKDSSEAFLFNMSLSGNGVALNAYRKNWRYSRGGRIYFQYGDVRGLGKAVTIGKRSEIHLLDSEIEGEVEESSGITIGKSESLVQKVPAFAVEYLTRIDGSRRGWYLNEN